MGVQIQNVISINSYIGTVTLLGGSTVINAVSDKPFDVSFTGCCLLDNEPNTKLQFLNHVDLGVRSDTGLPNRPPIAASFLYISIPDSCPSTFKLVAIDPDGDRLKCQYGQPINKESNGYNHISGITVNETTCELSFSGSVQFSGFLELVIEDFPQQNITLTYSDGSSVSLTNDPLSKIPLQVYYTFNFGSSCDLSGYIPLFLNSTPLNDERKTAVVGSQFEFNIRAHASLTDVSSIVVTAAVNLNKSFQFDAITKTGSAVVTWTPSENDVGNNVVFWFVAWTVDGYQSETRCIFVTVVPKTPIDSNTTTVRPSLNIEANVVCTETTMSLFVLKSSVPGLNEHNLRLNDPSCTLTSNSSHLIASLSLNSCGTQIQDNGTAIIFQNEISAFDYPNQIISTVNQMEIPFSCAYPKTGQASASFSPHKADYVFSEAGFGTFTFMFEFYNSNDFTSIIDPSKYPVKVELGQMLYVGISVKSSLENIKLFVDTCRSTPHDDPNDSIYYDIISNGCVKDDSVIIFPTNETQFNFGLESYNFIGSYPQVFITCSVILCEADSPDTRCSQGCIESSNIPTIPSRKRRSLSLESQKHFISQGPLYLAGKTQYNNNLGQNLNLNTVVIAVAFIVAVAIFSGALVYKAKMSKVVRYESLPSSGF
ncbi:ZPP protein, partial [Polypterus senegalus]|nr:ZPP protein [Polypterus senegalus]